ncbi:coxsackievirus and adenovirus receptor homolog isoform X2 [Amphiprion ocellaris]|uniref:coxsackievirus and adenovirus receptor homolog isoform X2 n=1 Tax=Amphiprion ocellaris TaxID=80972 RepID=UPI001649B1E4|nr:coxsackievirus and adenovirus receptor homolog isoform X2 [Amphiprion ocellaris]
MVCSSDLQVDVKPGEDALLPCRAAGDADLGVAEWRRADKRRSLADILVIRDGKKLPDQHPSVHGRVKLKDPEMKSRDVSVILKNVTINDTGTYECRIKTDRTIGSPPELVNIIELRVKDSGQTEDSEDDGTKHEGPKNEGTEDEGLSDLTAVFKVFIILAGLAFVIVLVIRYSELFVAFWEIARRPAAALNSWRIFLFKLW